MGKKVNKYLLVAIIISFFVFIFHYIEIFEIYKRPSYFSDSENYFKASSKFPPNEYDAYNFVYVLSFLRAISSYKAALAFFFLTYSVTLILFYRKFQLDKYNLLFLFHPFIIFLFARGLKESIIMILFLIFMRLYNFKNIITLLNIIVIILFSYIFLGLKPMGEYFIPVALILTLLFSRIWSSSKIFIYGMFFLLLSPLLRNLTITLIPNLKHQVDVLVLSGYAVEYTNNFIKPLTAFFFGPGPYKSMISFFYSIYEFNTFMTSVALFVGSVFSILIAWFISKKVKTIPNLNWNSFLIIITIIHVFTYILIQDGSVDTRQRGLMFFYLGLIKWK
jgi:hypothetical protein